MLTLLRIEFPFSGPFGLTLLQEMRGLASSIADENMAGGIYLFRDQVSASRYTEMHCARLAEFGLTGIDAKQFQVNEGLTALTRGPLE
ncbi:MAG: YdhR family protein [Candidatus Thiodiazotropha sp. (ex Rostrolucina anterorostrata)]|nr:YdhR family protein [Candidatus Thiodiazotropha sp. (ex Rostrolucina anterorostrata)]